MRFYSGDLEEDLDRVGWYAKNSDHQIHPVAEKEPNAFGLYDMHGNGWEWVEDDWHDDYEGAPDDGRVWFNEPRGALRVIRGGSWYSSASNCRSANRINDSPDRRSNIGFRLARSVTPGS